MKRSPGEFVSDLFKDLRDRRLLPVVGLLIVGLIGIPYLIGGDAETGAPPPAPAAIPPNFETDPVVIAAEPELRAYQERLSAFQSRNPFHQADVPPVPGEKSGGGGSGSGDDASTSLPTGPSTSSTSSSSSSSSTTSPALPTDVPTVDPGTIDEPVVTDPSTGSGDGSGGGGSGGGGNGNGGNGNGSSTDAKLITTRIEVRMGTVGAGEQIKDVRSLTYLPDPQHPVVQFLHGDFGLTKAYFVVSSGVSSTEGEGRCAPNPTSCEFLLLHVGESRSFDYSDGNRYRLKLVDVTIHKQAANDDGTPKNRASSSIFDSFRSFGPVFGG